MQFRDQLRAVWDADDPQQTHHIRAGERTIPVRLKKAEIESKTLIVIFHGAVDRQSREVPAFVGFSPSLSGAHQLAISDPTMLVEGDFSLSWYAGDQGFAAQDLLKRFFQDVTEVFGVERMVYFGTSGGGFAALYYSWHHPGSIAVAGNPQTRITDYYGGHISRYLSACWPKHERLEDCIETDIRALYAKSFPNFVIYVQSATDPFHLIKHLSTFLGQVGFRKDLPLVVNVDYFGKMGHSPTFDAYIPWLQAVMTVPEVTLENVVKARHAAIGMDPAPTPNKTVASPKGFDARSIQTAEMIRDWQLGDTTPWTKTPTSPSPPAPSGNPPSPRGTTLISKIFGRRST